MKHVINSEEIINDFGYWPTFHDDLIESISIHSSKIEIVINILSLPNGFDEYKVRLSFFDSIEFKLDGELFDTETIIFDIKFDMSEQVCTTISQSLGISGYIKSNRLSISKVV